MTNNSNYKQKLRKRGHYEPGFYSSKKENIDLDRSFELLSLNKASNATNFKSDFRQFINTLNSIITSSLKYKIGSSIKFSKFDINKQFKIYLIKHNENSKTKRFTANRNK